MLILGTKYKFTKYEKYRLRKKFRHIKFLSYDKINPKNIIEDLKKTLTKERINIIVLNTKTKVDNEIITYLTELKFNQDIQIITIEKFLEKYLTKCYIPEDKSDLHILSSIQPLTTFQYVQKRVVDISAVFTILILTWPILIYSRFRIKKESPGPSIFKQNRIGLNSKEFKCIKFRSMHTDAEKNGAQFASKNDPRVFIWGDKMRRTRIDEIPQILNVLKGDMHFIGPRPERLVWTKEFEKEIPYYNERHLIKPGITGWAQVMYPYGENTEDAKQKLMYDLYYIKNWSFLLDCKIAFKTIQIILGKKGI